MHPSQRVNFENGSILDDMLVVDDIVNTILLPMQILSKVSI